jgi:hypothetical protein
MVAGSMGIEVTSSGKSQAVADGKDAREAQELDTLQPLAGWFMYEMS